MWIPQHFDNVVTSFYHQKDDRHKKLVSISFVQKNANVGKGWFQPKQSGIQQLSHQSYNNIVCLLNWYRAVKKFKSTCISLADNEYNDCSRWLWNSQPAGASRDIPLENFEN